MLYGQKQFKMKFFVLYCISVLLLYEKNTTLKTIYCIVFDGVPDGNGVLLLYEQKQL